KIRSVGNDKSRKEKILRTYRTASGYERINIKFKGKSFRLVIHRVVAEAFVANPENKSEVNHKNRVKDNNRADNLEWVTRQENMDHYAGSNRETRFLRTVEKLAIRLGINYTLQIER